MTNQQKQLEEIILDPKQFIKRLTIRDKQGKNRVFGDLITPEQLSILDDIHNNQRVAIIKARQLGATTLCRAYAFWELYTNKNAMTTALISNKYNSAVELMKIDKRFHENLPPFLQRKIKTEKRDELIFASNKSSIKAFSGAGSHLRSYTFGTAHISEFDFIPEADELLSNVLASVNDGKLILESTPNHYGSTFHKIINDSIYSNAYKVVFLPYTSFPLYRKTLPKGGFHLEPEEEHLINAYGLDLEQVFWRREKIAEIKDIDKFRREYPLTIEEAYSLSGKNYFTPDELRGITQVVEVSNKELSILSAVDYGDEYVIGVDTAGGIGMDYSVAYVLSRNTLAPVAILSSNKLTIRDFTERVIKLSAEYRNALCVVEKNNHGSAVIEVMKHLSFYKYEEFITSIKSKLQLYDVLRTYIVDGYIEKMDSITYKELRDLIKNDKGLAPEHPAGAHDDRVIAFALALNRIKDYPRQKTTWDIIKGEMKAPPKDNRLPLPIRS